MKKLILWDWNGTLLDDLWYCIRTRNRVFPPMGIRGVDTLAQYYSEFTFPVRQYYKNAGVTDEQFEEAAHAWMDEYVRSFQDVDIFPDAIPALEKLHSAGIKQMILSATQLDMLREQVGQFPIEKYFSKFYGLDNIYAASKVELGRKCLQKSGISAADTVMIGDSLHDAQVAREIGIDCILICRGHQPMQTLSTAGVPIMDTLAETAEYLLHL